VPPAEEAGTALTVSEVAVQFGGVAALANASLRVDPGSVTGLIGPNGAGKTTLFNVISGLQAPDRGTVHLFDNEVTGMHPSRRARLGLARTFQRLELFGSLTAADNVRVGVESSVHWWTRHHLRRSLPVVRRWAEGEGERKGDGEGGGGPADNGVHLSVASRCELLLERVGLAGHGHEQVSAMSTGSARMVELARALAIEPKLLLLDEPGSGLDDAESQSLGRLLRGLAEGGMAVLLVEHDMELVMRICEYIYVLDFGDVIAAGTPDEIRADPAVQAAYLGAAHGDPIAKGR
jgi:branched-chain amino acid transport system ATP-binding protein